jgi:hypothetical protein
MRALERDRDIRQAVSNYRLGGQSGQNSLTCDRTADQNIWHLLEVAVMRSRKQFYRGNKITKPRLVPLREHSITEGAFSSGPIIEFVLSARLLPADLRSRLVISRQTFVKVRRAARPPLATLRVTVWLDPTDLIEINLAPVRPR